MCYFEKQLYLLKLFWYVTYTDNKTFNWLFYVKNIQKLYNNCIKLIGKEEMESLDHILKFNIDNII